MKGSTLLAMLAIVLRMTTGGFGQASGYEPWSAAIESPFESSIKPHMLEWLRARLALSPEQAEVFDMVVIDHAADFAALAERGRPVRERWDEHLRTVQPNGLRPDRAEGRAARAQELAPLADEQARLDDGLLERIGALLDESQRADWGETRLLLDRKRWPTAFSLSPESQIDLLMLCQEEGAASMTEERFAEWWKSPAVREIRAQHAEAWLTAVSGFADSQRTIARLRRQVAAQRIREGTPAVVGTGGPLGKRVDAASFEGIRIVEEMPALNRRFLEQFSAAWPSAPGAELVQRYWLEALRKVGDSSVQAALKFSGDARALPDLSAEQRAAIAAEERELRIAFVPLARKALDMAHIHRSFAARSLDASARDPAVVEALTAVEDASARRIAAVTAFLTPQQAAELKKGR